MAKTAYWVIGGDYADMTFERIEDGKMLERHGPFATYEEAHKKWAERAWATADNCQSRFTIVPQAA